MKKSFSALEMIKQGYAIIYKEYRFYLKTILILGGISFFAMILQDDRSAHLANLALMSISIASSFYCTLILMKGSVSFARGRGETPDVYSVSYSTLITLILAYVLVGIGSIIGLMLLIIPGLIFGVLSSYAKYIILDGEQKSFVAIKKSIRYSKPFFWSIIRFLILIVLIALPLIFLPFVGPIIIVALYASSMAVTYVYITKEAEVSSV